MSLVKKEYPNDVVYINDKDKVVIPEGVKVNEKYKDVFLSSKNFPKIKWIEDKDHVVKEIHAYINLTVMDRMNNHDPEEVQFIKERVTQDIFAYFDHFTLEEVRLALYYGVRGEFGKYYGLSPVSIFEWFKAFKSELQSKSYLELKKYLPTKEENPPVDQKKLDLDTRDILCDVYFTLCTEGEYDYYDMGNVGYNFLERLGLIDFTDEQKIQFMKESRAKFRSEQVKKNKRLAERGQGIQQINIERMDEQLTAMSNPTFENAIKIGAKRIALLDYLYGLAEEEIDLKELIDEKIENFDYGK